MKYCHSTHKEAPIGSSFTTDDGSEHIFFLFTVRCRLYHRNTSWDSTRENLWLITCCLIMEGSCDLLHEGFSAQASFGSALTSPPAARRQE